MCMAHSSRARVRFSLRAGQVSVVFIPTKHIRECSWPLLKYVASVVASVLRMTKALTATYYHTLARILITCAWHHDSLLLYGGCSFDENESTCANDEHGHVCRSVQTEIFSVVSDKEGATLFMDPSGVEMFTRAVRLFAIASI